MKHSEFKSKVRQHQIDFKVNDPEINVPANQFPTRKIRKNGKDMFRLAAPKIPRCIGVST
jgi:hypothetical protein